MSGTFAQYPLKGGGGGVTIFPTFSAFAPGTAPGQLAVAADTGNLYEWNGSAWIQIAGPGSALTLGNLDSQTATAQGAALTGGVLSMQSASTTQPGLVNTTTQSFAGNKTFTGTISASNLSGTNTGDVTIGTANGLSLASQVLSLALSSTNTTGSLSSTDWNTFNGKQAAGNYITALTGDGTATGPGSVAFTLATVNSNTGSFGSSTAIPSFTVNGKGLITAASTNVVIAPAGTLTGATLASGVTASSLTSFGTQAQALNMGSHLINNVTDPASAQDAATKNYVDTSIAALNPADACYAATAGSNISGTYFNGVAGVGATFTTTATGTFTVDGTTPPLSARILIKDQTSGFQNGIYNITTLGTIGVSTVFTRALDYDTTSDMNSAGLIPIINGTVNALSSWQQVATITTVGTDSLVFTEFTANPSLYLLKANNLSDVSSTSTSFNNISPVTSKGDLIVGSGTNSSTRLGIGGSTALLGVSGGTAAWLTPTTSPTASTYAGWDSNKNFSANNVLDGYSTTATAAGTTALTVSSTGLQYFTGSTTQTVTMPAVSTLATGQQYTIVNTSSGIVTVQSSGANTIQAMGTNTQLALTCISTSGTGTASWTWVYSSIDGSLPSSSLLAVTTETSNFNVNSGNSVYLCNANSAAFTGTLPTASGVTGQVYLLKKTDSSLNAVTVATTSSQTIDGSTTTTLNTQYEELTVVSDGSNWQTLNRRIPSVYIAYTPTITGFGTVSNVSVASRRVGDSLQCVGSFTSGTPTAVPGTISLGFNGTNGSITTDNSGKLPTGFTSIGDGAITGQAGNNITVIGEANQTTVNISVTNASLSGGTAQNANNIATSGNVVSFSFTVPVNGWSG